MRCPYCGSANVIRDPIEGIIVCTNCGYVIEENLVDVTGGTRFYDELRQSLSVRRRRAKPVDLGVEDVKSIEYSERIRHRRRLEVIVNARNDAEKRLVASITADMRLDKLENITTIIEFLTARGLLSRRDTRAKLAIAEAIYEYMRGRYPRFSIIARKYGVSADSIKRGFKKIVKALGEPERMVSEIEAYKRALVSRGY